MPSLCSRPGLTFPCVRATGLNGARLSAPVVKRTVLQAQLLAAQSEAQEAQQAAARLQQQSAGSEARVAALEQELQDLRQQHGLEFRQLLLGVQEVRLRDVEQQELFSRVHIVEEEDIGMCAARTGGEYVGSAFPQARGVWWV